GFVEPLESTGLLMITRAISSLVRAFPIGDDSAATKRFINHTTARDWDRLRWFLAAHYKFNRRSDSRFWQAVRADADISGLEPALELYRAWGPLSLSPRAIRTQVQETAGIFFYGLHGLDCILLGQKVPHAPVRRAPPEGFRARRQTAAEFARRAIPQAEAHKALREKPEWLKQLVQHPQGWVAKMATFL
ncbi:MAG: tryptophan 7-halogenase, partial [Myxococcales bacterium]|nr:tryptophan 7-halogenase [Myxococcales bacterium]